MSVGAAFWDARYAVEDYIFGTAPNRFLASQAALIRPGMRALAIADGEGRNGVWLAEQGVAVHAIDVSPVALEKARKLATDRGNQVNVLSAAETARWTKATADIDDQWIKEVSAKGANGAALLEDARALIRQYDK